MGVALAEEPVYEANVDVPLTVGAGAVFAGLYFGGSRQPRFTAEPWEPLGGIDALAVDHEVPAFNEVADIALYASMALGLAASVADGSPGSRDDRALLYVESMLVNGFFVEALKAAVDRPRPLTATEGVRGPDDMLSFPSGHAAFSTCAAMTTARFVDLRHDLGPGGKAAVYGGATAIGLGMGALRVAGGKHHPSDVLAGAALGGAVGWLVPELHRPGRSVTASMDATGRWDLAVAFAI